MVSSVQGRKAALVVNANLLQLHTLHLRVTIVDAWNTRDRLIISNTHLATALARLESILGLVAHHQGLALLGLSFADLKIELLLAPIFDQL